MLDSQLDSLQRLLRSTQPCGQSYLTQAAMGGKVCLTCAYVYNHQNSAEILQCSLLISQSPTDQNRALKEGAKKLLVKNSFFHSCFVFVPCTIPRS